VLLAAVLEVDSEIAEERLQVRHRAGQQFQGEIVVRLAAPGPAFSA
jgi:hypothetical protein